MSSDGWQLVQPPRPDPNAGYVRYRPPKRRAPKLPKRPTPPVRRTVVDPLAPLSDQQLRARALGLAQEQLGPILAQIQRAIEARSQAGQSAIRGYTQALGGLWQGAAPQTAAAYNQAIGQQSGVNSELANRLGSFGQNLGGELQGKLALQDAPQNLVGQVAGGATQTAQGVSNANFAKGAAETGRLVAESAHGQEYAAKQPGIVGLMGLQHSKQLEAQLNRELADQIAEQSTKSQDTFSQLYLHLVDQEWQKTLARTSGQFKSQQAVADAQYRAQQLAFKKAELAWKRAKAAADRAERAREANARADIAGKNANTARQNAQQGAANYYVDAQGRRVPKGYRYNNNGELVKIPTPGNKKGKKDGWHAYFGPK
jgi:hypothetical protein